jgi:hypothetical protein
MQCYNTVTEMQYRCDHSNEISSRQMQTLVIFKIVTCNKIKSRDQFKIVPWTKLQSDFSFFCQKVKF